MYIHPTKKVKSKTEGYKGRVCAEQLSYLVTASKWLFMLFYVLQTILDDKEKMIQSSALTIELYVVTVTKWPKEVKLLVGRTWTRVVRGGEVNGGT